MYKLVLLPLFLIFIPIKIFSWYVTPTSNQIGEGDKNSCFLTIKALGDANSTPVEIFGAKRIIDEKGEESYERLDHLFFIYPSICVVPPGETQRIRVFWKGDFKKLQQEEAYRIVLQELPVEIKTKEISEKVSVGISLLKTFVTTLYVTPKKAKPKLTITSHEIIESEGEKCLVMNLQNQGTGHITFSESVITLEHEKTTYTLDPEYLKKVLGVTVMLPSHNREFLIPLPEDFPQNTFFDSSSVSLKILKIFK